MILFIIKNFMAYISRFQSEAALSALSHFGNDILQKFDQIVKITNFKPHDNFPL